MAGPFFIKSGALAFRDRHLQTMAGQPPWRDDSRFQAAQLETAFKMPPALDVDKLLDREIFTSRGAVQDLGLDAATMNDWAQFLETIIHSSPIEAVVRQQLFQKMRAQKWDSELRKVMFQRAMSLFRNTKKSVVTVDDLAKGEDAGKPVQVLTPDQLQKAEARGGEYHRRVPKKGGKGFTYFYDPDKYNEQKDSHQSGEEMTKYAMGQALLRAVKTAGDGGCSVADLKEMAKKYGGKELSGVLQKRCGEGGDMSYSNGRFYSRKKED